MVSIYSEDICPLREDKKKSGYFRGSISSKFTMETFFMAKKEE